MSALVETQPRRAPAPQQREGRRGGCARGGPVGCRGRPGRARGRPVRPQQVRARRTRPRPCRALGVPLGRRGHPQPSVVAAGHHDVGRPRRGRGVRRPPGRDDELVLEGPHGRAQGLAHHRRGRRRAPLPARAARGRLDPRRRDGRRTPSEGPRGRDRLARRAPARRGHHARPLDLPPRRHHAGGCPGRPVAAGGGRGQLRVPLPAAGPLHLRRVRRRRPRPDAVLLHVARTPLPRAGAGGGRVRPWRRDDTARGLRDRPCDVPAAR